jgi:hypothetical protein
MPGIIIITANKPFLALAAGSPWPAFGVEKFQNAP